MQPDDWPFVVFITCFRHKIPSQAEVRYMGGAESGVGGQRDIVSEQASISGGPEKLWLVRFPLQTCHLIPGPRVQHTVNIVAPCLLTGTHEL